MFHTTSSDHSVVAYLVAIIAAIFSQAVAADESLTVWHSEGAHSEWLEAANEKYGSMTGVDVELVQFDDERSLVRELNATIGKGAVDVVFGTHNLGAAVRAGVVVVDGYCADEIRCGPCFDSNPPEWCKYARGEGFLDYAMDGLLISAGYCPEGTCPGCDGRVVPSCCLVKQRALTEDIGIDILQIGFTSVLNGRPGVIINGIPAWWRLVDIGGSTEIMVHGGYLHADSERAVQALDYMYWLYDDVETQSALQESRELFPANGDAFVKAVPQETQEAILRPIQEGRGGYPLCVACGGNTSGDKL